MKELEERIKEEEEILKNEQVKIDPLKIKSIKNFIPTSKRKKEEEERAALIAAGAIEPDELSEEEQQHLSEKQALQQLIDQRPAEVAMLVKTWLAEE